MLILTKSVLALMISFLISVLFGVIVIPFLKNIHASQRLSVYLEETHKKKHHHDERRRAEAVDVPAREVERLVEDLLAKGAREARRHAGGEVDADDVAHERACGAQHHVAALDEDLAHGGAGGVSASEVIVAM